MTNRLANPSPQFFDNSGNPLAGGKLYSYLTGSSTPAATYSDSALTTPNSNPITLDSAGRSATDIFLDPAVTYRFVLKSSDDATTYWTKDKVADPAAGVAAAVQVYNGNPNGFVAGNAGSVGGSGASLVYDITNERLYVCITTGNAAAAVWQYIYDPISGQEDVRTDNHTITAANRGRTQVANKATAITFTLPAVGPTGAGFVVPVKNIGAGALTIDGNASETIDGATTIALGQYESAILYCNGAAWRTLGRPTILVDYQAFTASGTWTKPPSARATSRVLVQAWGAGGGGGANATGGGGGGGGGCFEAWFLASDLGASEAVTVAPGGAVNTAGGNSAFGAWLTAYGGGAGENHNNGGGGGGGGATSAGSSGSGGGNGGAGGGPFLAAGGTGGAGQAGGSSVSGGAGGATFVGSGVAGAGGASYFGGGGGGGGASGGSGTGGVGGASVYGGGGGGGHGATPGSGGQSKFGGNGGAATVAGAAPGGGGGRNAAGGRGEIRVTTFI